MKEKLTMSESLLLNRDGEIATVVLNRPQTLNAINSEMYQGLPALMDQLENDPTVKVVIFRGAGEKSFASGADISEFERERSSAEDAQKYNEKVAAAEQAIENLTKPTIAMIHGYCIGGGAGLALSCDIRFSDKVSKFAITPAKLGLVYSLESTKRVVDLVGPSRAKWILMSGLQILSGRALELGLVDEVVEAEELEEFTYRFADTIATRAQFSVRAGKEMVRRVVAGQNRDDVETTELRNSSFSTDDYAEGVRAFLGKRRPEFKWS